MATCSRRAAWLPHVAKPRLQRVRSPACECPQNMPSAWLGPQTNQCRQTRPFTGPWESCDSIRQEHALVELILASITWRRFVRPPLADPRAAAIATMAATRARRLKADLTSSQPTKDDHRGNRTKHGNRDATELACGCGVFPHVQPRDAPAVWCFLPPGRVEEVAIARP